MLKDFSIFLFRAFRKIERLDSASVYIASWLSYELLEFRDFEW